MRATVLLIRHGHVESIDQPSFRGRQHFALTAFGMHQVEATAALIARHYRLDVVFSSPLTPCVTMAATVGIADGLALPPQEDLIDMDYGEWQGRSHDDVLTKDGDRAPSLNVAAFVAPCLLSVAAGHYVAAGLSGGAVQIAQTI